MKRSAAASSSPVVTPARALPISMRRQRTSTSPAAAILSTCSVVLGTIIRYTLTPRGADDPPQLLAHLVGRAGAIDPVQQASLLVVADQRLGLLVVGVEPVADHLRPVVVADHERAAVVVADALLPRRAEVDVED